MAKAHTGLYRLAGEGLDALFHVLLAAGYQVLGPTVVDGAVQYRELQGAAQLPWGIGQQQHPGSYRLQSSAEGRAFAWANGPQGVKPLFFAPQESLWRVERGEAGLTFHPTLPSAQRRAIIGVRPCDLAALALQDQHFLGGVEPDPNYARRREETLLVAVNCSHPAATCFCAATGDGPNVEEGFDLRLDELDEGFLITAASPDGDTIMASLALVAATPEQQQQARQQRLQAAQQQRSLPQRNLHGRLSAQAQSPHWQAIADRCLACANCTAVCPTCFCHSELDVPTLDGGVSEHLRQWDSCFSHDHSYLHGLVIRAERAQRYRQWLTHKFDHWHQQYGRSGCVGCGRCISWCPVGIDVTEELQRLCGGDA